MFKVPGLLIIPVSCQQAVSDSELLEHIVVTCLNVWHAGCQVDFLGEITTGNLHLLDQVSAEGDVSVLGLSHLTDIVDVPYDSLKGAQKVCTPPGK